MKIKIISFSTTGSELAKRIIAELTTGTGKKSGATEGSGFPEGKTTEPDNEISAYIAERHADKTGFVPFSSVYELTARLFDNTSALVYIGACGIAVRAIAPLIKSKLTDPAVVVCDETGRFAISLLSGHVGGANALTEKIAEIIGAMPVITTASDSHAALENINLPKNLVLGIGCRRGVTAETIERSATILLWDVKIPLVRVCDVATIDIKRDECGLLGFVKAHDLPLSFYSAEELAAVTGEFSSSERVLQAVGVDNVCERAAVLCGKKGKLILKKTAKDGVTVAVFEKDE